MKTPQTYVVDIDGTICTNTFGDYETAEPFIERIQMMNDLQRLGNKVIYFTARGMGRTSNNSEKATNELFEFTFKQLESWGVKHDGLFFGKPSGDVYIDDKAVHTDKFFGHREMPGN